MSKKKQKVIIFIILVLAFLIRVYSIGAQLPQVYWHDEKNYIETALRFGSGNFMPYQLSHGGFFYSILFLEFLIYYGIGFLLNFFNSPLGFYISYLKDPSPFFIIGRLTVLVSSLFMILFVYKAGKLLFERMTGVIAALFAAFSLLSVQLSSAAHADMVSVAMLIVSFYIGVKALIKRKPRLLYVAAFLGGLATALKYYCVFSLSFIIAFELIYNKDTKGSDLLKSVFLKSSVFIAGFIIGAPFSLNLAMLYKDTVMVMGKLHLVESPHRFPLLFHLKNHFRNAFGVPLQILTISSIFYALIKKKRKVLLVLLFPFSFYLLFSNSLGFCHHLLPILPFLVISSAVLLTDIFSLFRAKPSQWVCFLTAIFIISPSAIDSMKYTLIVPGRDTRTISKQWVEKNIKEGSIIMEEGNVTLGTVLGPPLRPNRASIKRDIDEALRKGGSGASYSIMLKHMDRYSMPPTYDLHKISWLDSYVTVKEVDPEYIITSGFYNIELGELNYFISKDHFSQRRSIKRRILQDYDHLAGFYPTREFTIYYPMTMLNKDYVLLRSLSWDDVMNFKNGSVVDIYKKKSTK